MSVEAPPKPEASERPMSLQERLRAILEPETPKEGSDANRSDPAADVEKPTQSGVAPVAAESTESGTEATADETAPADPATEVGTETTDAAESTGASEAATESNGSAEEVRRLSAEVAMLREMLLRGGVAAPAAPPAAPPVRPEAELTGDMLKAWNEKIAAGDHLGAVSIVAEARAEAKFRALVDEAREQAEIEAFKRDNPDFEQIRPAMKAKHDEIIRRGYLLPDELRAIVVRPGPKPASKPVPAAAVKAANATAAKAALAKKAPVASAGARPTSSGASTPTRTAAAEGPAVGFAEYLKQQRSPIERLLGK